MFMQKRWFVLNVAVLIIITLILIGTMWKLSSGPGPSSPPECLDVNNVASFVYDLCYDAYTKNIFVKVRRNFDTYNLKAIVFSFFDFNPQTYEVTNVPAVNQSKAYKIPSEKNPGNLNVKLKILKDFSAPICKSPRTLQVRYCPVGSQQRGVNVSISLLKGTKAEDFVGIAGPPPQESDIFSLNLVDKEAIWKSQCESKWKCSGWESCEGGIQKRSCEDLRGCPIPTDIPERVRYCDGECQENWECTWSECSQGFTIPKCRDTNNCGTSYKMPQKLSCDNKKKCVPDVSCSEWSECEINYNLDDLMKNSVSNIQGIKSRICKDRNGCIPPVEETRNCSVGIDVYTRKFVKCGKEFIGVYNLLDNRPLARIDRGTGEKPHLNIYLDDREKSPYCDYCFDGVKDGDETGVDCGGSCDSCSNKYKKTEFRKKTWRGNLISWIKRALI